MLDAHRTRIVLEQSCGEVGMYHLHCIASLTHNNITSIVNAFFLGSLKSPITTPHALFLGSPLNVPHLQYDFTMPSRNAILNCKGSKNCKIKTPKKRRCIRGSNLYQLGKKLTNLSKGNWCRKPTEWFYADEAG